MKIAGVSLIAAARPMPTPARRPRLGQAGGHGEEDRAVRGRGVPPHRGHLVGERAPEPGRPVQVDVHVRVDRGALGEVAADVPAEQRRRE
jgi:hypothetical protein